MKAHHVILGAASSAAVYKSLEIGSRLRKRGIIVHPVLTKNASRLISPRLFSSICGNEACVEMFQKNFSPSMPHIDLTQTADCILIAPATANILSKIAHGTGDDLLTTLCLARRCPLIVAPAMNPAMWQNYFTQHNAGLLKKGGVTIIEPVSGRVACQEEGIGRLADVDIIVEKVICHIPGIGCPGKGAGVFAGKKILITGGSSEETIDPVRAIVNHSSGKMAGALCQKFLSAGANVTYVYGRVTEAILPNTRSIRFTTTRNLLDICTHEVPLHDVLIMAAAPGDYYIENASNNKLKKTGGSIQLILKENPDILASLPKQRHQIFIAFSAETENLLENAAQKLLKKNCDIIITNYAVGTFEEKTVGMGSDWTAFAILGKEGVRRSLKTCTKDEAAEIILQEAATLCTSSSSFC